MSRKLFLGLATIFLLSCSQPSLSNIEIIKFNPKIIDSLKNSSDTMYTENFEEGDFRTIDYYITVEEDLVTKVLKDSMGNIVGLNKSRNGTVFFTAEYYPNGQLIGKTHFVPGKIDGPATYFYPDGRVRSLGQWKEFKMYGIWKNYYDNGELKEIVEYDSTGNIVKQETFDKES